MKIKAIKLKDFYKSSDCMYTNIIVAAKRARQIIDSRYEKVMLEKNIEDTDQLEALVAMDEFLDGELEWRESEDLDEE